MTETGRNPIVERDPIELSQGDIQTYANLYAANSLIRELLHGQDRTHTPRTLPAREP